MTGRQRARRFGEHLKRLREDRKLSIRELARKAQMADSTLGRLERGEYTSPQPDTLKALASALQVPLADLLAMADYMNPDDLPNLSIYLRTHYGRLPEEKIAEVEDYLQQLLDEHGLDPNGPAPLEDETESPSEQ